METLEIRIQIGTVVPNAGVKDFSSNRDMLPIEVTLYKETYRKDSLSFKNPPDIRIVCCNSRAINLVGKIVGEVFENGRNGRDDPFSLIYKFYCDTDIIKEMLTKIYHAGKNGDRFDIIHCHEELE